jgi:hypothetical protein
MENYLKEKIMSALAVVEKWNPMWLIFPGLIASLALYWIYISRAQPQVPYMDSMLYLAQVEKILKGDVSWFGIYGSGEHRGLIFPFVLLIEWIFWAADSRVTTLLTGGVVAVTFYYWLRSLLLVRNEVFGESYPAIKTLLLAVAAAFIIVSPAAFELWTLDLGFAQLIKNFLLVLFFYQLSITRLWAKSFSYALVFGFWGSFLILFATYGWSYPFLAAVVFAVICIFYSESHVRTKAAAVLIPMIFAQCLYVYLGHGVFSNSEHASQGLAIFALVKGALYGAGSSFMGMETMVKSGVPVIVPIIFGGFLLGCSCLALVRTLITPSPVRIFEAALLVFSLSVLAGVTLARGASNYLNTGASRYFVDYVWLLLAPILIFTRPMEISVFPSYLIWLERLPLRRIYCLANLLMAVLLVIALLGHLRTWQVELKTAPYRAEVFKAMSKVYRQGVAKEADANLLQSPYEIANKGVDVAQRYNLAVLRTEASNCNIKLADYTGDWYLPAEDGTRWMGRHGNIMLRNCSSGVNLKGYVPINFSPRNLDVSYREKKVTIALEPGKEFFLHLDQTNTKNLVITLHVDRVTSPLLEGIGADQRALGILLTYIGE